MSAQIIETNHEPFTAASVDPITLDLIENGLVNAREQMDAVLFRTAMSPIIREQRDGFPMVTDRAGRLHAGQFGSCVESFLQGYEGTIEDGDILLTSDPYACNGSVSHANDWLVCIPVFHEGRLLNWTAMFGHQTDIGGRTPGSMPVDSTDLYQEGIIIPPVKLYARGELQKDVLRVILHNCRKPAWNEADLNALIASCRIGKKRCLEMATRFGTDVYVSALDRLLERNYTSMRKLVLENISEEKVYFEDYICDDAMGMGPYKLACHMWREGDRMIFDFGATDPQSRGNINLLLSDQMFKMFCGQFMLNMFDPQILLNDGFFPLIDVRIPNGSLLRPIHPAGLTGRTHAMGRIFDVISGLFGSNNPEYMCAAGFSDSPHFMYSGYDRDKKWFLMFQIGFGGVPGRPGGDGADGHSLWPKFRNIPNEFIEAYFPVRIERFETIPNTGGAGKHRGGNAVRYVYAFLERGEISIHDDRWFTYPWGVNGGKPGMRGRKELLRSDGRRELLPAKVDRICVEPGDHLVFDTWGGGGWGDPLQRDLEAVRYDLECGLLTAEGAKSYGVVAGNGQTIDETATVALRASMAAGRGPLMLFDRGGTIEELRARCLVETGLPPPQPPVFHELVRNDARARVSNVPGVMR
jgi:N-methylhydantoinase B